MESDSIKNVSRQVHAFLFSEGGSLTLRKLTRLTGADESRIIEALRFLTERLEGTGLTIIQTDTEVSLVIERETSPSVQKAFERELATDIGDAGLEVMAIVLYRGPSTRTQIDYIRGVNTSSTIRTLLSRRLLERTGNPDDGREYLYRPTVELLAHIGVRNTAELPDHERIVQELRVFESTAPEFVGSEQAAKTGDGLP